MVPFEVATTLVITMPDVSVQNQMYKYEWHQVTGVDALDVVGKRLVERGC